MNIAFQDSHETLLMSGVEKFLSRRPIVPTKIGWLKPKCTTNRDTTRNTAFCSLLPKKDLQLLF